MIYILLLRNLPIHSFNRIYLLFTTLCSFILPIFKLPEHLTNTTVIPTSISIFYLPDVVIQNSSANVTNGWYFLLVAVYGIIAGILFILFLNKLYHLNLFIKKYKNSVVRKRGYKLLLNTGYGPASWGNYIFLPEEKIDESIIRHEYEHIKLHHSFDVLIFSVVQCAFWYNPFVYLMKKEVRLVHEFQADAVNKESEIYSSILLSDFFNTCTLPFVHSFIHHPLKLRIMMLHKKNKRTNSIIRISTCCLALISILILGISFQSCKSKDLNVAAANNKKASDFGVVPYSARQAVETVSYTRTANNRRVASFILHPDDNYAFNSAAKMPEFKGGQASLVDFLIKNIKYPNDAKIRNVQGRVVVKFIVDRNGKVKDATVIKSPDPSLSLAALEVVKQMPDWIPGENKDGRKIPVYFTLPISFRL